LWLALAVDKFYSLLNIRRIGGNLCCYSLR
jgi:hypothetical protein